MFETDVLNGESVVVTGSTGEIGASVAETLAEMGASVLLTGRNADRLEDVGQVLSEIDVCDEVRTQQADVTDHDERAELAAAAEQFGVTMLVNSAGISGNRTDFEDLSLDQLTDVLELNFTATLLLTRDIYAELKRKGAGAIVNIASLSGLRGTYKSIPYCSSKFALVGFTQALSLEAIEHGVRVNAVCPGWVETEMGRDGIRSKAEATGRTFKKQFEHELENLPSNRMTTPQEVANAVGYLLSDASENVIGESLKLSGGSVLR